VKPISSQNSESTAAVRAETEDGEVIVEGGRALDAQPAHDGEARSINERKVLVTKRDSNLPGCFRISRADWFDDGGAGAQTFPEPFGRPSSNTVSE